MSRTVKRLLRTALYLCLAVIALSLGLRIYCAWHIPRAKQLMNDMSQLRALRPFDDHIHNLITEYGFRAADPDHCNSESCDYQVTIGAPYPRVERLNDFEYWAINRLLVPLGFHPWQVWARLQVEHGRLNSTNYTFGVLDPTGFGAGGSISAKPSLEHPNEDSPNFTMGVLRTILFLCCNSTRTSPLRQAT
jgi:hypothetical protein